ncbi:MAG: hypothetical protein K2N03_00310, partial [Muribaculaceae bacterium]|nr:hypothetical protein [Muribaculaceae bacterium]
IIGNKRSNLTVHFLLNIIILTLSSLVLVSCKNDEPHPDKDLNPDKEWNYDFKSATLIYAVASNDLYSDFRQDSIEMLEGAKNIDLNENLIMLYSVTPKGNPKLQFLFKKTSTGEVRFCSYKEYDRNLRSTDIRRISDVINTFLEVCKTENTGLIFWSHSTGWLYQSNTGNAITESSIKSLNGDQINAYAFGQDKDQYGIGYCNIPDLAKAIPDHKFQYLWFDCCYMSNIESLYQLRNKAKKTVAYPTEIYADGMPYNQTLPLLARINPELIVAADRVHDYFGERAHTIAVINNSELENFATIFSNALRGISDNNTSGMLDYSNRRYYPARIYDLGEYTRRLYNKKDLDESELNQSLDNLILYKECSGKDFNNLLIDKNQFHGISISDLLRNENKFYRSLDWYNRVSD